MTFKVQLRRKALFYTVNLISPCVLIAILNVCVFYLPADAREKIMMSISILLALIVFLLLVSKILPPTSLKVPLVARFILFTFITNVLTIASTVLVSSSVREWMSQWMRSSYWQLIFLVQCSYSLSRWFSWLDCQHSVRDPLQLPNASHRSHAGSSSSALPLLAASLASHSTSDVSTTRRSQTLQQASTSGANRISGLRTGNDVIKVKCSRCRSVGWTVGSKKAIGRRWRSCNQTVWQNVVAWHGTSSSPWSRQLRCCALEERRRIRRSRCCYSRSNSTVFYYKLRSSKLKCFFFTLATFTVCNKTKIILRT